MVGQPAAAVTVPVLVPGVVGVVVELLMVTLPPVPGEAMSLGPQALSAIALQPTRNRLWMFFTMDSP
jgi:hypothetical protein